MTAHGVISEPPSYRSGNAAGEDKTNEPLPPPPPSLLPPISTSEGTPSCHGDTFPQLGEPNKSENSPSISGLLAINAHLAFSQSTPSVGSGNQVQYSSSFESTPLSHVLSNQLSLKRSGSLPETPSQSQDEENGDSLRAEDKLTPLLCNAKLVILILKILDTMD